MTEFCLKAQQPQKYERNVLSKTRERHRYIAKQWCGYPIPLACSKALEVDDLNNYYKSNITLNMVERARASFAPAMIMSSNRTISLKNTLKPFSLPVVEMHCAGITENSRVGRTLSCSSSIDDCLLVATSEDKSTQRRSNASAEIYYLELQ